MKDSDTARLAATHTSATATQTHAMGKSIHQFQTSRCDRYLSTEKHIFINMQLKSIAVTHKVLFEGIITFGLSAGRMNMDWKIFITIFASVFIAELGDKTQLATMLFATDKEVSKSTVFLAASAALIVASAFGVLAGSLFSNYINEKYLHYFAGIGFMLIGGFTLYNA